MWDYGLGNSVDRVRRALGGCEHHDPDAAPVSGVGVIVDRADVAALIGYIEKGQNFDHRANMALQDERDALRAEVKRLRMQESTAQGGMTMEQHTRAMLMAQMDLRIAYLGGGDRFAYYRQEADKIIAKAQEEPQAAQAAS